MKMCYLQRWSIKKCFFRRLWQEWKKLIFFIQFQVKSFIVQHATACGSLIMTSAVCGQAFSGTQIDKPSTFVVCSLILSINLNSALIYFTTSMLWSLNRNLLVLGQLLCLFGVVFCWFKPLIAYWQNAEIPRLSFGKQSVLLFFYGCYDGWLYLKRQLFIVDWQQKDNKGTDAWRKTSRMRKIVEKRDFGK